MSYTFTFDSRFCSGCKACQVACKDKNNLPLGVLWRRVYEISGGEWTQQGEAWENTVFAYNLSIACNHCVHPKCAGVCPAQAYTVREDGIVILDESKCIGCRYCAWACPYGAPQYDLIAGRMTKCDLCVDNLEQGLPPACVAACPMRVLELEKQQNKMEEQRPESQAAYPLPTYSHTEPRLVIQPHATTDRAAEGMLSNEEEVRPKPLGNWAELPLVAFTLLTQMAIGTFWFASLVALLTPDRMIGGEISLRPAILAGILVILALFVSFFHLGTPTNGWRSLAHLRKSWLSREILFTSGFAGFLGVSLMFWTGLDSHLPLQIAIILKDGLISMAFLSGALALYSMARVYYLKTIPAWKKWHTLTSFFLTSLVLGWSVFYVSLAVDTLSGVDGQVKDINVMGIGIAVLLVFVGGVDLSGGWRSANVASWLRRGLILLGIVGTFATAFVPVETAAWIIISIFPILLAEEVVGRWSFYEALKEKTL